MCVQIQILMLCFVVWECELVSLAHSAPLQVRYLSCLQFAVTTRDREKVAPTQQHPPWHVKRHTLLTLASTQWELAQSTAHSPHIGLYAVRVGKLCPAAHVSRLLRLLTLENNEFAREAGHVWPLWRAWQRDAEAAAGELQLHSVLTGVAGGMLTCR